MTVRELSCLMNRCLGVSQTSYGLLLPTSREIAFRPAEVFFPTEPGGFAFGHVRNVQALPFFS